MINKEILFSILVPVYNVELYLHDSIQSVLNQTYENFELILVDDGSTDNSGKICDYYSSMDKRIMVFHNDNNGLLYTRRYAFSKAHGDYYIILDSDDKMKNDALEVIYKTIQQDGSDCIIYGYERVCEGKVIDTFVDSEARQIENKGELYLKVFTHTDYNALWRKAFSSSLLDGRDYSAYYGISMGEDLLQSIEILENCKKVSFIPFVLYEYTLNPNSLTQNVNENNYAVENRIRSLVKDMILCSSHVTDNEIKQYKSFCQQLAVSEIKTIGSFSCNQRIKKLFLSELFNDEYYQTFVLTKPICLNSNFYNWILFYLFKEKYFSAIITMTNIVRRVKQTMK